MLITIGTEMYRLPGAFDGMVVVPILPFDIKIGLRCPSGHQPINLRQHITILEKMQ